MSCVFNPHEKGVLSSSSLGQTPTSLTRRECAYSFLWLWTNAPISTEHSGAVFAVHGLVGVLRHREGVE